MKLRKIISKNIKKIRLAKWLSQESLANLAGIHRTFMWLIERWKWNLSIDILENIAIALKVQPVDLLE